VVSLAEALELKGKTRKMRSINGCTTMDLPVSGGTNLTVEPELSYQPLFLNGSFTNNNPSAYGRLALHTRYQLHGHLSFFGGLAHSVIIHNEEEFHGERRGIFNGKKQLGTAGKRDRTQFLGMVGVTLGVSL